MPITSTDWPILSQFLCSVQNVTGMPMTDASVSESKPSEQTATATKDGIPHKLPKGVVLGKDGKPCRSCTSAASWMQMIKTHDPQKAAVTTTQSAQLPAQLPADCPADVEELGRGAWTMLHTMTANYPPTPTPALQQQARSFLQLFSNMYPCSHCADDFREWMSEEHNTPRLGSRDEFGRWMCAAHNAVNEKLGKERFDCNKWEQRWRTGPPDGRCG